jgi:hypothetical protein
MLAMRRANENPPTRIQTCGKDKTATDESGDTVVFGVGIETSSVEIEGFFGKRVRSSHRGLGRSAWLGRECVESRTSTTTSVLPP